MKLIEDGMHDLESGNTMLIFEGTGHSDEDIIAAVREHEEDRSLLGYRLEVEEVDAGWSPRFMWCSRHDHGWGCDNEGEWHRHYSDNYGNGRVDTQVHLAYRYTTDGIDLPVTVERRP